MRRGGDYPGFGLRGQERRKRFDLLAEAGPPSPSARVTHRGCGWEVDPERGLNQATGPGAGGVELRGGARKARRVWLGRRGARPAGEWRLQGSWPERHARSPPPASGPEDSDGTPGDGIRCHKLARGDRRASSGSPLKSAEGCTQVSGRVLFWLPRGPAPTQRLPPCLGRGAPEPSGPGRGAGPGAARADHGGLWNAPGDHLRSARTATLDPKFLPWAEASSCLGSFCPMPAWLETPSLKTTFSKVR